MIIYVLDVIPNKLAANAMVVDAVRDRNIRRGDVPISESICIGV